MLLEVGVSALESSLKQIYKDENFDLRSILASALAEVGMGTILKTNIYKDASEKASNQAAAAARRAQDLAARKNPNQRLINNANETAQKQAQNAKALNRLNNTGKAINGLAAKTDGNGAQNATEEKQEESTENKPDVKKPDNIIVPNG